MHLIKQAQYQPAVMSTRSTNNTENLFTKQTW